MATTTRRIQFSKIRFLKRNTQGNDYDDVLAADVFNKINTLPFTQDVTGVCRYLELDDGDKVSVRMDMVGTDIKGKIGRTRLTNLPPIDTDGMVAPLNLPAGGGLFEASHFILFTDGLIGYEANFFGPRLGRLCLYMKEKASDLVDRVEYQLLWTHDVAQKLQNVGSVTVFSMRVHRDVADAISRHDDDLGKVFAAARTLTTAPMIQIDLRVPKRKRLGFHIPWLAKIVPMLADGDIRQGIESLWLRAKNDTEKQSRLLDLLQDALISQKSVLKEDEKTRSVDAQSMYAAIIQAREELGPAIDSALQIQQDV